MKTETIDYIWAILSFITVGVSFHMGYLLYGLVLIFLSMAAVMFWHIMTVRKRLRKTVAVYGRITDYQTKKGAGVHYYPVVCYTTEGGREINSIYSIAESSMRYETGDEEMICYDPDDPMFFCFAAHQDDFIIKYYRLMIFAVIGAVIVFGITLFY